jgi:hypothetical protein
MSFRVLIVPEDPTYNGSILKPLCERILADCGKPNAHVEILSNPRTRGYEHAKALVATSILDLYPMMDIVLFLPDADDKQRQTEFQALEDEFNAQAASTSRRTRLFCCAAVQEVEIWLLAGHLPKLTAAGWNWASIRADRSVKENYFQPFLNNHGEDKLRYPDQGRRQLMLEGLANYGSIKQRCPELAELERRMQEHIASLE